MFTALQSSPLTWSAVAALGAVVVGLLPFFEKLLKNLDIEARRTRVLERAKQRLEVWDKLVELQIKVLPDSELAAAKLHAAEAVHHIQSQTDESLRALNSTVNPVLIPGIPQWRHHLLLYCPKRGHKFSGYINRACAYGLFIVITGFVAVFAYLLYLNARKVLPGDQTFHTLALLALFAPCFLCLELIFLSIYKEVFEEGAQPVVHQVDRL